MTQPVQLRMFLAADLATMIARKVVVDIRPARWSGSGWAADSSRSDAGSFERPQVAVGCMGFSDVSVEKGRMNTDWQRDACG
ncbi:MAG: hypothetical protein D8M59_05300 [Planctomycetes bacterium]|nr:hypothetical protein [Planctomycetota bacterium]